MKTDVRTTVELVDDQPAHRRFIGLALAAGVVGVLTAGLLAEPTETAALPAIARYAMVIAEPLWHTTEPVNEIVYGTRGFDTFGETFLLLAAVIGISTIARRKEPRVGFIGEEALGREEEARTQHGEDGEPEVESRSAEQAEEGRRPGGRATPDSEALGRGLEQAEAMTVVVRGAARAASPLLLVAGIYLVAWGYSPGGGFPAGAVILGVILLAYVSYGYRRVRRVIRPDVVETLEMVGALMIVAVEALGLVFKGSFAASWLPLGASQTIQSGGVLQAFSGSELIEVGTGLTLAVFGLLGMGHDWSEDEGEGEGTGEGEGENERSESKR
jgi:multicomponent Na+:H+ antiporter subunit B